MLESCNVKILDRPDSSMKSHVFKNGILWEGDCLDVMRDIPPASVDMVFADPPYNIAKADWDKFESQERCIAWSMNWIKLAAALLKESGSLFICGFSEILADLKHPSMKYFKKCRWLIWHYRNKANLGRDWGRSHESILLLRKSSEFTMNVDLVRAPYGAHTLKYPSHPQAKSSQFGKSGTPRANWMPNPAGAKPKDVIEIPTTCNGMGEKTAHPTQKPEELLRKIVLSSSNQGDTILDPFSGSGTTLVVAEQLGRKWIGCEMNPVYNDWALERLNNIKCRDIDKWIEYDKKNVLRRRAIR